MRTPQIAPATYCGAKGRKGPCKATALYSNGRCKWHGGPAAKGTQSGTFITGKYSKLLPRKFASHYDEATRSKELLELRDEAALLDAQVRARLEALTNDGDGEGFRKQVAAAFACVQDAMADKDLLKLQGAIEGCAALIARGADEFDTLNEVNALVAQRAKLVEAERGHHLRMKAAVTLDEMKVLMTAIHASIAKHVPDPATVLRISQEVQRMVGGDIGEGDAAN